MRGQLRSEAVTAGDGTPVDVDLWMPDSYHQATKNEKDEICNGCGPDGWLAFFVSESASGVPFYPACNIHDWMYYFAAPLIAHKDAADRVFQNNLTRLVRAFDKFDILGNFIDVEDARLRDKRLQGARTYYLAVSEWGGDAFWANKGGHDLGATSAPPDADSRGR